MILLHTMYATFSWFVNIEVNNSSQLQDKVHSVKANNKILVYASMNCRKISNICGRFVKLKWLSLVISYNNLKMTFIKDLMIVL